METLLPLPPLLCLPPELKVKIFTNLPTFTTARSLALTCRSLAYIHSQNSRTIICALAEKCIPSYDDALRTARASALGLFWPGTSFSPETRTYPTPPTHEFITTLSDPPATLAELHTILNLHSLIRTWQLVLFAAQTDPAIVNDFHRASYRFLLLGYLFAGAYLSPLRGRTPPVKESGTIVDPDGVCSFPPFAVTECAWREQQLEQLFGGFIDWIFASGRTRGRDEGLCALEFLGTPENTILAPAEHGAIRELLLLLTVLELLIGLNDGQRGVEEEVAFPRQEVSVCLFGHLMPVSFTLLKPGVCKLPPVVLPEPPNPTWVIRMLDPDNFYARGDLDLFRIALKRYGLRTTEEYLDYPWPWAMGGGVLSRGTLVNASKYTEQGLEFDPVVLGFGIIEVGEWEKW